MPDPTGVPRREEREADEAQAYCAHRHIGYAPDVSNLGTRDGWKCLDCDTEFGPIRALAVPAPETGRQWSHCPGCGLVVRLTESGRFVHHELFERRDSALDLPVRKVCNGSGAIAAPPLPAGRPEEAVIELVRCLKQHPAPPMFGEASGAHRAYEKALAWDEAIDRACEVLAALPAGRGSEVSEDGARLDAIEENGWDVRDASVATPVGHPAAPTGDVTVIYDVTEWCKGERRVVASGGTVREALDNAIAASEAR